MNIDPSLINESAAVLVGSFGEVELRQLIVSKDKSSPYPLIQHPLGSALTAPHEHGIAHVLEIAEYLKWAASSPEFRTVVNGVRHQFEATRLQLAAGYRLTRAGASELSLEPPVAGGRKADLSFVYGERGYVAECFVPDVASSDRIEVDWLTKQAVEALPANRIWLKVQGAVATMFMVATRRRAMV